MLADAWVRWQADEGMGLDYGIEHLKRAVLAADKAAAQAVVAKKEAVALAAMRRYLEKPDVIGAAQRNKAKAIRTRALGSPEACKRQADYDLETVKLLAADFPAWLEEAGVAGFLRSVLELGNFFDHQANLITSSDEVADAELLLKLSQLMRGAFEKPLQA